MKRDNLAPTDFMIRIVLVAAGLTLFAYAIAFGFHFNFGAVALLLGFVSMVTGNLLGLPSRRYERRNGIRHINMFKVPAPEEYVAGNLFVARNPAHFCSFENALLLAGFVILILGLIILL